MQMTTQAGLVWCHKGLQNMGGALLDHVLTGGMHPPGFWAEMYQASRLMNAERDDFFILFMFTLFYFILFYFSFVFFSLFVTHLAQGPPNWWYVLPAES